MTNSSHPFIIAAHNALWFLQHDHGFTLTETIATQGALANRLYKVTYRKTLSRSQELYVCLSTAPLRLEQDLEFGHNWPPEFNNTINVFELLDIESPGTRITSTSGVYEGLGDLEKMSIQYSALANVLQNHGMRFFANDPSLWEDVQRIRVARSQQREHEEMSRMAESAFKQKDWKRAIELLGRLGDKRTKLQTARLDYARKRVAK